MRWIAIAVVSIVLFTGCSVNKVHVRAKAKTCGQTIAIELKVK